MYRTPLDSWLLPTIRADAASARHLSSAQARRDTLVESTGQSVDSSRASLTLCLSHADRVQASLDGYAALLQHIRATISAEDMADPTSREYALVSRHGALAYLDQSSAESIDSARMATLVDEDDTLGARTRNGHEDGLCDIRGAMARYRIGYGYNPLSIAGQCPPTTGAPVSAIPPTDSAAIAADHDSPQSMALDRRIERSIVRAECSDIRAAIDASTRLLRAATADCRQAREFARTTGQSRSRRRFKGPKSL